jgi:hypothetical protein
MPIIRKTVVVQQYVPPTTATGIHDPLCYNLGSHLIPVRMDRFNTVVNGRIATVWFRCPSCGSIHGLFRDPNTGKVRQQHRPYPG